MIEVRVEDVVKAYDAKVAVDGVSFEVGAGEVFGLLGPNGAGKSTLIRMTMDILRPDTGRILLAGRPSTDADHDRVGYLPEERGLYRKAKVLDVLDYFGRLKGLDGSGLRARAMERLERVGLAEWAGRKVEALSKGMQQKVQIVATLLHDPDIVILDEPFSGLDPVNVRLVKEMIGTLKATGRIVVLSTHQMDQVEELCDRIVMIDRGRRVLYGTVREIKSRYAEALRATPGRPNVVQVDGDGDFASVPGVLGAEVAGHVVKVTLEPGVPPATFLERAIRAGLSISHYDARPATLEEIFVHVATREGEAA